MSDAHIDTATPNGLNEVPADTSLTKTPSDEPGGGNKGGDGKIPSPPPAPHQPSSKTLEAVQGLQDDLLKIISRTAQLRRWRMRVWWKKSSPELLKIYGVIYNHLVEIQRLLTLRHANPPPNFVAIEQQLQHILQKRSDELRLLNIHAAWEFAAALERVLLLLGDNEYVHTRLRREAQKESVQDSGKPGTWGTYLGAATLKPLLEAYDKRAVTEPIHAEAVEHLAFLYASRSNFLRNQRAREELKAVYLNRLTLVLTLLLLLLIESIHLVQPSETSAGLVNNFWNVLRSLLMLDFVIDLKGQHVRNALIAAATGALGSTLSGFYKLRDESGGIATVRAFGSAMLAQPFVGATVGVLLWMFLQSGLLAITPDAAKAGGAAQTAATQWFQLGIYCFIAGFSEPFFLGVVGRVAGAADKKPDKTGAADDKSKTTT